VDGGSREEEDPRSLGPLPVEKQCILYNYKSKLQKL